MPSGTRNAAGSERAELIGRVVGVEKSAKGLTRYFKIETPDGIRYAGYKVERDADRFDAGEFESLVGRQVRVKGRTKKEPKGGRGEVVMFLGREDVETVD